MMLAALSSASEGSPESFMTERTRLHGYLAARGIIVCLLSWDPEAELSIGFFLQILRPASIAATLVVSRHRGMSVISCTVLTSHSIVPTGSFLTGPTLRSR